MKYDSYFWELYREYLKSDEWALRRQRVLERDRFICQACLNAEAVHVHHKTYDHVFDEPFFDLVSVCKKCHDKIHDGSTWKDRGYLYGTRNTVEYEGLIGMVSGEWCDDGIIVRFRNGEVRNLMVWDVAYRE